jgi:hypothetical protein
MAMLRRLADAFRRWREKNREYRIQRALYREAGGLSPVRGTVGRMGPPDATHTLDPWQSSEDDESAW